MLLHNLCTQQGLVNGVMGVVSHLDIMQGKITKAHIYSLQ